MVDTITWDECIGRHKIQRCDIVKIDVEGTEDDVVRGMGIVLRRLRPQVIKCETSACWIADALLRRGSPEASGGVFVHFHDIFLPFEYPQSWVIDFRWGWNEQYLVQAFLYNNSEYEIVWPAHYMWTQYKGEVLKAIACDPARASPSGFWLRKIPITATAFKIQPFSVGHNLSCAGEELICIGEARG